MTRLHTIQDARRLISDQFARIDTSCYSVDFNELVEIAAEKFVDILREKYRWKYGDEIPENDIDYFELISEQEL